jgi:hypothetical protein
MELMERKMRFQPKMSNFSLAPVFRKIHDQINLPALRYSKLCTQSKFHLAALGNDTYVTALRIDPTSFDGMIRSISPSHVKLLAVLVSLGRYTPACLW